MDTVSIQDFARIDLRVAKILEVEPHPNADRLYVLKIDGGEEQRQLVAGVRLFFTPEELIGRSIVVVWNLEPATIRGVESQGMLLAGRSDDNLGLLAPAPDLAPGAKVS